jgi:protein gp37
MSGQNPRRQLSANPSYSDQPWPAKLNMSSQSSIEWTDATWNPVRGCTKISAGCKHCYAERFAERFRGVKNHAYERGFDLRLVPEVLAAPFSWAKSRMIFVNSMSDLFHQGVPAEYVGLVADVMGAADWHIYQVLTKRAARLGAMLGAELREAAKRRHIWWGVSVENKKHGIPRIKYLQDSPAAVRFLSIEPLLEDLGELDLRGIHWVIVGGESGPGARPIDREWVRSIRDQCEAAGVPFFFKQWGGVRKHLTGRRLDRRTHNGYPDVVHAPMPSAKQRAALRERVLGPNSTRRFVNEVFPVLESRANRSQTQGA